jgi:hypothetical protein
MTEVARTILQQLGGSHFIAMTGAKLVFCTKNGLTVTVPKNVTCTNRFEVRLNDSDLYDLWFYQVQKNGKIKLVKSYRDVFFDDLQDLYTETTGLYTKLF